MKLKKIEIKGYRGFSARQEILFGSPSGDEGSGLTFIVGPNNSGKSTVIEALQAFCGDNPPTFSVGKRNVDAGRSVELAVYKEDVSIKIVTDEKGGAGTKYDQSEAWKIGSFNPIVVPSRRTFSPFFNKGGWSKSAYSKNQTLKDHRQATLNEFSRRLWDLYEDDKKYAAFNELLERVLGYIPSWNIEQSDQGQFFLNLQYGKHSHNSEGAGEGLLSALIITDALFDSEPGDVIAIDEPELSLHPGVLRRLAGMFREYSKDRQIVISTHSPYFVDFESISNGAQLCRLVREDKGIKTYNLSASARASIPRKDANNPHLLGLDARETFFLPDKVVLVEGQEDAVILPRVLQQLNISMDGNVFGWGVGGADKMIFITTILKDLGFKKVVGILDSNKADTKERLEKEFGDYKFILLPADDIRSKAKRVIKKVVGLADSSGKLNDSQKKEKVIQMVKEANEYLGD